MNLQRNYSILVILNEKNEIFIQDRRSISKKGEDWGFFGWWIEDWESFEEGAIREAKEELNIDIRGNIQHIWETLTSVDTIWSEETHIYLIEYKSEYDSLMEVLEGDWWKFVSLHEYKSLKIVPWTHIWIEMIEKYLKNKK